MHSLLEDKTWLDGEIVNGEDSKTPILTHTLHYASGVFEGVRAYKTDRGPAVFRLHEHIDRLFYSAGVLGIEVPYTKDDLVAAVCEVLRTNNLESAYIRPLVFQGQGKMGLAIKDSDIHVSISAWEWGAYLGEKEAVDVHISKFKRIHPETTVSDAKICGHYTNSILASHDAKKHGMDEALLLDHNGMVAEGPGENIFFVKGDTFYTPKNENILPGITRNTIMEIVDDLKLTVVEKDIAPEEITDMDEAFFVGTAVEVTAIRSVDETVLTESVGEKTKTVQDMYSDIIHGKIERYERWLTFVNHDR